MPYYIADTSVDTANQGYCYCIEPFMAENREDAIAKAHAMCLERADWEAGRDEFDETIVERLRAFDEKPTDQFFRDWIDNPSRDQNHPDYVWDSKPVDKSTPENLERGPGEWRSGS